MNENGGVRTFEEIVSKELGLTKDYFKIGKIGSNTKNFVDFTAADRKNYIGTFLNIEDIIKKYNIANAKLKALKKDITSISGELSKFKEPEVIETEIKQIEELSNNIDAELSGLYKEEGALSEVVKRSIKELDGISLEHLKNRIDEKKRDLEENKNLKNELNADVEGIENIEESKNVLDDEIQNLKTEMQINNSKIQNQNLLISEFKNKLDSTTIQLNNLGNPEDIQKLETTIIELTNDIVETKTKILNNPESKIVNEMLKNKKDISAYLERFINFTDFVEKYFKELSSNSIMNIKSNIECFFEDDFDENFRRQILTVKNLLNSKQSLLISQQKERGIKEGHVCQLKNLEKRPEQCSIDDCPFIKEALLHKNVLNEISEKDVEILQTKKDIEDFTIKLENLQEYQNLYLNFQEFYKNLRPRENDIFNILIKDISLVEWLKEPIFKFQARRQEIISNVNDSILLFNSYSSLSSRLSTATESKKIMEDSDSTVREKYISDIAEFTEKIKNLTDEVECVKQLNQKLSETISMKTQLSEKYLKYINAVKNIASISTMLSTTNSEYTKYKELYDESSEASTKLAEVQKKISELSTLKSNKTLSLDKLKAALTQVNILKDKLTNLNKMFNPVNTIVASLSPTSGIPLILIKTYLEETEAIANELLSIAFGEDFRIKFLTTEKEFSIQVQSKENIKSDIKMASQGEVAITTISLSLALIEQSIGNYNILCLDEIDGPLDSKNRTNFMDILDGQINKLGIEQVFVISHNDAFDVAGMDLILLNGNNVNLENESFMKNKNIIFNVER